MSNAAPTTADLIFKVAVEDWELEQVHRLNYRTFVEEIPQHDPNPEGRLVDRFHAENTYIICLQGRRLVGMLAVRATRPFSLDSKLPNLDAYLPKGRTPVEVRLLAVEPEFRKTVVFSQLFEHVVRYCLTEGYDIAIISGTTRQQRLYQHLGFVPFGPVVGSGDAQFQPMFVTLETFEVTAREFLRSSPARSFHPSAVNFLPGPVAVRREVRRAFEQAPESHRAEGFITDFQAARQILCELVRAKNVELFVGSGTSANDAIAGQLSLLKGRGLVLTNGEFGERLVDHARRFNLKFDTLAFDWGRPLDLAALKRKLSGKIAWLWCVHCETSTGILADLDALKTLCAGRGVKLCLDGISAIGSLPVDLSGVYLASCASGKGLRAYPGLSMVFYSHEIAPAPDKLPRYLDLGYYGKENGTPFTFSSNLLHALHAAVKRVNWEKRFAETAEWSAWLRSRLTELGFELVGNGMKTSPAVVTIALPPMMNSVKIGEAMQEAGYLLSYNSGYLRRKNWIQICLLGECTREKVVSVTNALNRVCFRRQAPTPAPTVTAAK